MKLATFTKNKKTIRASLYILYEWFFKKKNINLPRNKIELEKTKTLEEYEVGKLSKKQLKAGRIKIR